MVGAREPQSAEFSLCRDLVQTHTPLPTTGPTRPGSSEASRPLTLCSISNLLGCTGQSPLSVYWITQDHRGIIQTPGSTRCLLASGDLQPDPVLICPISEWLVFDRVSYVSFRRLSENCGVVDCFTYLTCGYTLTSTQGKVLAHCLDLRLDE